MSTRWYLFCPASGLGFLLMEFPWLFFSQPTKMLPFCKFFLPFSPLLSRLSRSLFCSLSLPHVLLSLFVTLSLSRHLLHIRSFGLLLPHEGTTTLYTTVPFRDAEVLSEGIWLSLLRDLLILYIQFHRQNVHLFCLYRLFWDSALSQIQTRSHTSLSQKLKWNPE